MSNTCDVQTGDTGRKGVRAINEPGAKGAFVKRIGAKGFKGLKSVHLFFVSLWIGGSISLLLLSWLSAPATAGEIALKYSLLETIDYGVIIPGALGCLLTGVAFGLLTNFGFLRYGWVAVKWVLIVLQIGFGTFFLGRWLMNNALMSSAEGIAVLQSASFLRNENMAKTWGIVQVAFLVAVIGISVAKPRMAAGALAGRPKKVGQFQKTEVVS